MRRPRERRPCRRARRAGSSSLRVSPGRLTADARRQLLVMLAAQAIRDGDSEIVIAGGQENMSLSPHVLPNSRNGARMGDWKLVDSMIVDGLWGPLAS